MTDAEKTLLEAVLSDIRDNACDWNDKLVELASVVAEERCSPEVQQLVLKEELDFMNAKRRYRNNLRELEAKFSTDAVEVALAKAKKDTR